MVDDGPTTQADIEWLNLRMVFWIPTLATVTELVPLNWVATSMSHSGIVLGTGFLIGAVTGGVAVQLLYRHTVEERLRTFTLADVFASRIGSDVWDPFHVSTTTSLDGPPANKERILRVLIANRGRIKQADIADATGWSDATVSRLLSRMELDGDVSRVNVGRTKLVFLGDLRRVDGETSTPTPEST